MRNVRAVSCLTLPVLLWALPLQAARETKPLQSFVIKDHLSHRWTDEIVHFDFDVPSARALTLTDSSGNKLPTQFSDEVSKSGRTRGKVWTVLSLEPGAEIKLQLREGEAPRETDMLAYRNNGTMDIVNAKMAIRIPEWPGELARPIPLTDLPAPLLGVRGQGKTWLCGAQWFNRGVPLMVKQATTTLLERGPVREVIQQKLLLTDGRYDTTTIEFDSRQEAALVREDSNINDGLAGWRLSMQPGLGADHVLWNNQWKQTEHAQTWGLTDTAIDSSHENVVARLRPWSFWWLGDLTMYAGFYKRDTSWKGPGQQGDNPFVSVLMLHPSRWTPGDWDGFDRLEIPIMAGPGGRVDMDFAFLANRVKDAPSKPSLIMEQPDVSKLAVMLEKYKDIDVPLHREWAIAAGTAGDNVVDVKAATLDNYAGKPSGTIAMRRQLLKYGEFPLDAVKDYGFDYKSLNAGKGHPFLLIDNADVARVRREAKTDGPLKAQIDVAKKYIAGSGAIEALQNGGPEALQGLKYAGDDYIQKLPEAYLGSDDPVYGKLLAAAVVNLTQDVRRAYIEAPIRPALASYGPWPAEQFTRLLFATDLIAGKGLLTPEQEEAANDSLVFAAQVLSNPDYWSLPLGLSSANPNMTSMIRLPLGLIGLYLAGHPRSEEWSEGAETEFKHELADWIDPSGAWIESPGYQQASMDGILLFATAVRNARGRDYFTNPKLKATLEYMGYLLTPPDRRLPLTNIQDLPTMTGPGALPPSALVTIGDTPIGSIFPFNGWMAFETAKTDPAYSARQQFFWEMQNYHFNSGNRAKGFTVALTDTTLKATPPSELSRGFPGFGSLMRSSWTDRNATFVAHRTGPNSHHYHQDFNSIDMFAKGAPLCLDFGNQYQPVRREEPWYHNRVSFNLTSDPVYEANWEGVGGELLAMRALGETLDYSYGRSYAQAGEQDFRHVLFVKSADPMGANYVVMRDTTKDGKTAAQPYYWNLWCLSKPPVITGNVVHFPGQFDVDLDVTMLSPAAPKFSTDSWKWEANKATWGNFSEEQYGVRVTKTGSAEDYLAVLYPRATGQAAAKITSLAGGAAMRVGHMEGADTILLSPGKPASFNDGDASLTGEIAYVRHQNDGGLKLAVVAGDSSAAAGDWAVASTDAVGLEIAGKRITGECSGDAHTAAITLPEGFGAVSFQLDGKWFRSRREGRVLTVKLPVGVHTFSILKG